jgi:hypothetical protein
MASQMLPLYFNPDNDKELLEWLKKKTNRSAFMRTILYDRMILETRGQTLSPQISNLSIATNVTSQKSNEPKIEIDDNFNASMSKFANFKFKK